MNFLATIAAATWLLSIPAMTQASTSSDAQQPASVRDVRHSGIANDGVALKNKRRGASASSSQDAQVMPLPSGYLHTNRSQIVDSHGNAVRLDCVGWGGGNGIRGVPDNFQAYRQMMRAAAAGFNCLRLTTNDVAFEENAWGMGPLNSIVQYAGKIGLKVIIDHHNDEGGHNLQDNWGAQQKNGLWFDKGPGTNGTDGGENKGTVTATKFKRDWVQLARHFAGNDTVIGFDLDNEPTISGSRSYATVINWGKGGPTDIWAMCTNVGNAVEQADPGVLIICEGPQNYSGTFAGDGAAPEGDLTMVAVKPVILKTPNKIVYSVHIYPKEISGVKVDSGPDVVKQMNHAWGYLVNENIAPVWIGEMGASMNSPDDTAWASMMIDYVNGQYASQGGPVIPPGGQGVGTDWWELPNCPGNCEPNGWLKADNKTPKPEQAAVTIQLRPTPAKGKLPPLR